MSSVSWYFVKSPFMLSPHLFFGRPLLPLPETSRLSDFAQMWLGSRLKQWQNHFSIAEEARTKAPQAMLFVDELVLVRETIGEVDE